jgi:hypothetical protein
VSSHLNPFALTGARRWQTAAIVLLLASVASLATALWTHSRAVGGAGLSALLSTSSGEVWMGVDDRLWRASREGALKHDDALADLGLPRPPANLVQAPDGRIVASVRGDATLYVLDPASARVVDRIVPRWPADIAQHGGRAINLAFHADGRFAIATGGGHLVALFDPKVGFLGRTAPETYRYSNGLWWIGDALWTTDTNRFQLKRLDPASLVVAETLQLPAGGGGPYLGPARRHPRAGDASGPMAALVRYENGMTDGRVVVVARDGRETPLRKPRFEPRDVDWLDGEVIASDGISRSVLRWGADGSERAPFGDDALQQRLDRGARERTAALQTGLQLRWLAAVLFLVALGCALRARRLERVLGATAETLDLSQLGTPRLAGRELMRRQAEVYLTWSWLLLPMLALQGGQGIVRLHVWLGRTGTIVALLVIAAACMLAGWLSLRRLRRMAQQPQYERVFNHHAMTRLARESSLPAALREGEVVLETFMWIRRPRVRWAVLTNERLLQFYNGFGGWKQEQATERSAIGAAKAQGERFAIRLRDGQVLKGRVQAQTVAARVAQALSTGTL